MHSRLITLAAWSAALAVVLWQRLLLPALERAFPGFSDLLTPQVASHETRPSRSEPPAPGSANPAAAPAPVGLVSPAKTRRTNPAPRPKRSSRTRLSA